MDIGTHSGSCSGTGSFIIIALGDGCHSGTGSVPSGQEKKKSKFGCLKN